MLKHKQMHLVPSTKFNSCKTRLLVIGFSSHHKPMTDWWISTMTTWEASFSNVRMLDGMLLWVTMKRAGKGMSFGSFYCKPLLYISIYYILLMQHISVKRANNQMKGQQCEHENTNWSIQLPSLIHAYSIWSGKGWTTTRHWWLQLHLHCCVLWL